MLNRRTINNYLGNRGLATLDNPSGLMQQLGFLVEDHAHFKQLINKCSPEDRRSMYESLRPYLRFEAKPLDVYVAELGQEAEAQQLPTIGPDGHFQAFKTPEIRTIEAAFDEALATVHLVVTCRKCTKEAIFPGQTKAEAIFKARNEGWALDHWGESKYEVCPGCPVSKN
jgi:hypothetical protein